MNETAETSQDLLGADLLPLYLQSRRLITSLQSENDHFRDLIQELKDQIIKLETSSVDVKSICVRCRDQSLDESCYDNDSMLYQKIFEKNMATLDVNVKDDLKTDSILENVSFHK